MIFWLSLGAVIAGFLWYMVKVPGTSYSGALPPLTPEQAVLAGNLQRHVVASRPHRTKGRLLHSEHPGTGFVVGSVRAFIAQAYKGRRILMNRSLHGTDHTTERRESSRRSRSILRLAPGVTLKGIVPTLGTDE